MTDSEVVDNLCLIYDQYWGGITLILWKFKVENGRDPSPAEFRAYCEAGHANFKSSWEMMLEEFKGGREKSHQDNR